MKKLCRILLIFVFSVCLLCGCGGGEETEVVYKESSSSYYFRYVDKEVSYVKSSTFDVLKNVNYESNLTDITLVGISFANDNLARVNNGKVETLSTGKTKVTVSVSANGFSYSSSFDLKILDSNNSIDNSSLKIKPITHYSVDEEDASLYVYSVIISDKNGNAYMDYSIEILNTGSERTLIDTSDKVSNNTNVKAPSDIVVRLKIKDTRGSFETTISIDPSGLLRTE